MRMLRLLPLLLLAITLAPPAPSRAQEAQDNATQGNTKTEKVGDEKVDPKKEPEKELAPTEILADSTEYDMKARKAVFEGNVEVVDERLGMTADRMLVDFDAENKIKLIVATGNVVVTRGDQKGTGGRAVYDFEKQVIVLTEKPILLSEQGKLIPEVSVTYDRAQEKFSTQGRTKFEIVVKSQDKQNILGNKNDDNPNKPEESTESPKTPEESRKAEPVKQGTSLPVPKLLVPRDGEKITDFAFSLAWEGGESCALQIADNPSFSPLFFDQKITAHAWCKSKKTHIANELPKPGKWYVRIGNPDAAAWSTPHTVTLVAAGMMIAPPRKHPLVILPCDGAQTLPPELNTLAALRLDVTASDLAAAVPATNVPMFVCGDGAPAEYEWIFKNRANVQGILLLSPAELDASFLLHVKRLTRLCAQYGRRLVWIGGAHVWDQLDEGDLAHLQRHSPYLTVVPDNHQLPLAAQGLAMGLWLDGTASDLGCSAIQTEDSTPHTNLCRQWILGIAQGATLLVPAANTRWRKNVELIPFLNALTANEMFVQHREVMAGLKAVLLVKASSTLQPTTGYGAYAPFYQAAYGIAPANGNAVPYDSRCYFVPITRKAVNGVTSFTLSQLGSVDSANSVLAPLRSKDTIGTAWNAMLGDRFFIITPESTGPGKRNYGIPLVSGSFFTLSGEVGAKGYVMGRTREGGKELWLQTCDMETQAQTTLSFDCLSQPEIHTRPADALKSSQYADGRVTVALAHTTPTVELTLTVK